MFGVPETPYDLRFQLLGMPVRVHPLFWLVAAMLGWRNENIPLVLIWVGCVFVSILVHEYGHGLVVVPSVRHHRSCFRPSAACAFTTRTANRHDSAWPFCSAVRGPDSRSVSR